MKNKVQIMSLKQYVAFIIGILLCIPCPCMGTGERGMLQRA